MIRTYLDVLKEVAQLSLCRLQQKLHLGEKFRILDLSDFECRPSTQSYRIGKARGVSPLIVTFNRSKHKRYCQSTRQYAFASRTAYINDLPVVSCSNPMDDNLSAVAEQGDIKALYEAINSDPSALNRYDSNSFLDTPFHVAAHGGQTYFALEMMILKPSLGRKLNQNGYSPMHLAVINEHEELVMGLVSMDKDLIRVKGQEGRTPLHCLVTVGGKASVLKEMLCACPDSIQDLTIRRETALHLAVKHNHYEAFKVLVEFVKKFHQEEIFSRRDEEGYTVLHHATTRSQIEMIKFLFQRYKFNEWKLGVNVRDGKGQTAVQMAKAFTETHEHRDRMKDILVLGTLDGMYLASASRRYWAFIVNQLSSAVQQVPTDSRDAMLVVLALANTTSFQVGVNPPGGFWQDDGITGYGKKYFAGTPVLATTSPYLYCIISLFTMAGFASSLGLIFVLTIGMPMKYLLLVALAFLSYGYLFAFAAITRIVWIIYINYAVVFVLVFVVGPLFVAKVLVTKIFPKFENLGD